MMFSRDAPCIPPGNVMHVSLSGTRIPGKRSLECGAVRRVRSRPGEAVIPPAPIYIVAKQPDGIPLPLSTQDVDDLAPSLFLWAVLPIYIRGSFPSQNAAPDMRALTLYIDRARRRGTPCPFPRSPPLDFGIPVWKAPQKRRTHLPLPYSRSSVVSLICCSAKNDRMSTTAGWRIRVSIANLEKCARSATWMRSR